MDKNTIYTGVATTPSDHDAPDGQLSLAVNLVNEYNALRPLLPFKKLFTLPSGYKAVYIHNRPSYTHYIVQSSTGALFWIDSSKATGSVPASALNPFISPSSLFEMEAVGNTLVILTGSGMFYFLWKDGDYIPLGSHIPEICLEFALIGDYSASDYHTEFSVPEDCGWIIDRWLDDSPAPGTILGIPVTQNGTFYKNVDDAVYGVLNKYISEATENNKFTMPFFVRYALKLFDGSYTMQSAPILMIPISGCPLMLVTDAEYKDGKFKCSTKIDSPAAILDWRLLSSAGLSDWKDLVTGVDVFVSQQVFTFRQEPKAGEHVQMHSKFIPNNPPITFHHTGSRSLNCETPQLQTEINRCWVIPAPSSSDIEGRITSVANFYKVASVTIDELLSLGSSFTPLDMDDACLSTIETRPTLSDDWQSHHKLVPRVAFNYNSRLNIADVGISPFAGFPIRSMVQFTKVKTPDLSTVSIYVKIQKDGISGWVSAGSFSAVASETDPSTYDSGLSYFPRFLFYPDPNATEMIVHIHGKGYFTLHLKTHDFLNGAFWFRGLGSDPVSYSTGYPSVNSGNVEFRQYNKIYNSEVNNPFFFPLTNICTVGSGRIVALCAAVRALSQGQFGQFPMYAFSTDGVWSLSVAFAGNFTSAVPVTRDVCINPRSVVSVDTSVIFTSEKGLMRISGSESVCFSEAISLSPSFIPGQFRHFDLLLRLLGSSYPDMGELFVPDIERMIKTCRFAYDYVNSRIYAFSPGSPVSFVYSMKSGMWGMSDFNFSDSLNSYPRTLVSNDSGEVFDISDSGSQIQKCLLLSRPFSFDAPDMMKTVSAVINRGVFGRDDLQCILYGSRDLQKWSVVHSSRSSYMRNFSGSPYKWFRLAVFAELGSNQSISSFSASVAIKLNNRLR